MISRKIAAASMAVLLAATPLVSAPVLADDAAQTASVVQANVNAYRARNMSAFAATFHPDAIVVFNGIEARGRAQIRAAYAANFSPGAPTVRIIASYMSGERLYLEVAYVLQDGSEMCCSQSFFTVENGLITRLDATG